MGVIGKIKNSPESSTGNEEGDALGELIAQVSRGDDAALESLYDQSVGKVYSLAPGDYQIPRRCRRGRL